MLKVYWSNDDHEEVHEEVVGVAGLRRIVERVERLRDPTILLIEHSNGRSLLVGLGGDETVMGFMEPDGRSFHSKGDVGRHGVLKFWCLGQLDDFLAETAVAAHLAVDASVTFAETGQAPTNVSWEADW